MKTHEIVYDPKAESQRQFILKRDGYRDAVFTPTGYSSLPGFFFGYCKGDCAARLRVHIHQLRPIE